MDTVFSNVVAVLPSFAAACVAIAALPGPATALYLHRTVRDGRRQGAGPGGATMTASTPRAVVRRRVERVLGTVLVALGAEPAIEAG